MGDLESLLKAAGFEEVSIEVREESRDVIAGWMPGSGAEDYVASAKVCAVKPDPSQANISYGNTLQNTRHQNSNEPRDVIKTTPEDLAILNECSSEALWSKSVPLMVAMSGTVLFLKRTYSSSASAARNILVIVMIIVFVVDN